MTILQNWTKKVYNYPNTNWPQCDNIKFPKGNGNSIDCHGPWSRIKTPLFSTGLIQHPINNETLSTWRDSFTGSIPLVPYALTLWGIVRVALTFTPIQPPLGPLRWPFGFTGFKTIFMSFHRLDSNEQERIKIMEGTWASSTQVTILCGCADCASPNIRLIFLPSFLLGVSRLTLFNAWHHTNTNPISFVRAPSGSFPAPPPHKPHGYAFKTISLYI
jgi:hypothetical protein